MSNPSPQKAPAQCVEPTRIIILAGGRSARMGTDKSRLLLGNRTLLEHVRATAKHFELPVQVIRRDIVPGQGPLGGIHTAFKRYPALSYLFLSCDMPFVSTHTLTQLLRRKTPTQAVFTKGPNGIGFPCLLSRQLLGPLETLLFVEQKRALRALACKIRFQTYSPPDNRQFELSNVNTPADWEKATVLWRELDET